MATSIAVQQEALTRAVSSQSFSNYAAIIRGFMAKGLPESAISPRENVFTYNAWKALGRQVKKGEHGVRCLTFIVQRNKKTGREEKRPWSTTVFHISQTEPVGTKAIISTEYVRVPMPSPAVALILPDDHDATPENVPYAGEDEASRESGLDDAIAAHIQPVSHPCHTIHCCHYDLADGPCEVQTERERILSIEQLHTELETSGAKFEHVQANEVDWLLTKHEPEVIPAPVPKDSAYDRAMRGEQVSIMDIIDELNQPKRKRQGAMLPRRLQSESDRQQNLVNKYGANGAARIEAKRNGFQSKTVEF